MCVSRLSHEERRHGCFERNVRPDAGILSPQSCKARHIECAKQRPVRRGGFLDNLSGQISWRMCGPDGVPVLANVSQALDLIGDGCLRSRRGPQVIVAVKPGSITHGGSERQGRFRQSCIEVLVEELGRGGIQDRVVCCNAAS